MASRYQSSRRPIPVLPAVVIALLFVVVLAVLPRFGSGGATDTMSSTSDAERGGPFGRQLPGAMAYLGSDRVVYLLDLETGAVLGSKAIPGDRRPAAASGTHAYLGSLSDFTRQDNWDSWRAVPWAGTRYHDLGPGNWIAAAVGSDMVAVAMHPLPAGGGGLQVADSGSALETVVTSEGLWGMLVWTGDELLARELIGREERWWLIDPKDVRSPRRVSVPAGLVATAGGPGVVAGWLGGEGVLVDVETGAVTGLSGPLTWAAAWDPSGTRLASVSVSPPMITTYGGDGAPVWARRLHPPLTPLRGGVAWSPDGSFLVVAESGTVVAYEADGDRIGQLDGLQPSPETEGALLWVVETGLVG